MFKGVLKELAAQNATVWYCTHPSRISATRYFSDSDKDECANQPPEPVFDHSYPCTNTLNRQSLAMNIQVGVLLHITRKERRIMVNSFHQRYV